MKCNEEKCKVMEIEFENRGRTTRWVGLGWIFEKINI